MGDQKQVMISVIIPVYNSEKYLHKCIDSVLAQSYQDFELILVNDGSEDSSGDICDEYGEMDERVKVFHQENRGVSASRNRGLKAACGEWVYFVDADDYLQLAAFDIFFKNKEFLGTDIIRFGLNRIFHNGNIKTEKPHEQKLFKDIDDYWTNSYFHVYTLCVNYLRLSIIADNNLSFTEKIKYAEDLEFTAKYYLLSDKILTLNEAFYNYNIHDNSAMAKQVSVSSIIDHSLVLYNIVDFITQNKKRIKSQLFLKDRIYYFLKSFLSRISIQEKWCKYIGIYQKEYRKMYSTAISVLGTEILTPFFIINKLSIIPFVLIASVLYKKR